jgi:hypothetical protein
LPDAETIRQELAKAKSINDLTDKDGVFSQLFGQTLTAMLEQYQHTVCIAGVIRAQIDGKTYRYDHTISVLSLRRQQ